MVGITLADDERGNQLGIGIQGDKRPNIAVRASLGSVLFLSANESPYLVHLDLLAGKTAHLFIHDDFAGITHANTKAHDRITVHAGHAFNAADAIAFGQHGNHHDFLFGSELVCHGFRLPNRDILSKHNFVDFVLARKHSITHYAFIMNDDSIQSMGGKARAESLSAERLAEIARKGAVARWGDRPVLATHKGSFQEEFGSDVECYVLNDSQKTAVISQSGMGRALGLSPRGNAFPRFMESKAMKNIVGAQLREKLAQPIKFQWAGGGA